MTNESNERLLYGFDPLCGWCFAFGPTIDAIRAEHADLAIELRYGGLVVGERVAPIAASRDYLRSGLAQVAQRAGVAAGDAFYNGLLSEGSYVSNSEPPCRAIWAAEQVAPDRALDFALALPQAFYQEGMPLDDERVLTTLAERHNIESQRLLALWRSGEARTNTQTAFIQTRAAGFTSYPTLAYQQGARTILIARGWLAPTEAVAQINNLRTQSASRTSKQTPFC
ncbi:MAG: DsbA family protein [Oscillochloris sp.]|nr:DsbA family protein [Oscillochloris sp.]